MARRSISPAALAQAQELVPFLAEMIEQRDPCLKGLDFNQIEANSAAIGDCLARALMKRALHQQGGATAADEVQARRVALERAAPKLRRKHNAEDLQIKRQKDKRRKLKTVRGEVEFSRIYLYFPELQSGIFPPR